MVVDPPGRSAATDACLACRPEPRGAAYGRHHVAAVGGAHHHGAPRYPAHRRSQWHRKRTRSSAPSASRTNVTETRTIAGPPEPRARPDRAEDPDLAAPAPRPSTVTIVDMLKAQRPSRSTDSGRTFNHRFPVSGHWRQQACGPNHSQRKPKYIGDYLKGPADAPLIAPKTRVHVLRGKRGTR